MKEYDVIAIGTGSAMNIVDAMLQRDSSLHAAVIDKDEPGGICLTRGCIPSKILLYPAEVLRTIQGAARFGLDITIQQVDFSRVMDRMRRLIGADIEGIRRGLSHSPQIDYFPEVARFVAPYTLDVGGEEIHSDLILLCTGSQPLIPPVDGLEEVGYETSDTIFDVTTRPDRLAIIGGGYIAAEFGHFFAAMGSEVTILGRNPQFLPQEEPEVAALAQRKLGEHMAIRTNVEVRSAKAGSRGTKRLVGQDRSTGEEVVVEADAILVAAGRGPNSEYLDPAAGGIETDARGWIRVNERLETSQPGVYALGDAVGRHLFKHVANYESTIVYFNALFHQELEVDYHAVPHAVFTYPEVASVGLRETEAIAQYGPEGVLVGFERYQDTAKGEAMGVTDYFVKVLVARQGNRLLGAHIIGPHASILIQEVVNLMYTPDQSAAPMLNGMHIHPALSEVVERAFGGLMPPGHYHHLLAEEYGLAPGAPPEAR